MSQHSATESPARSPLVVFNGVHKSYGGKITVVEDLNLEIQQGEFLTLLGPSGSGKTTTLMMLAGFEAPSAGEIFFGGKLLNTTPTYKRNFGMVFQNYALFPHMTVAENLAFPLKMHKFDSAEVEPRVLRALDMVKLQHLANRKPAQLSGGQQQRVALARALIFEPRMVLMDEPLGALDKQLREHMQLEIKALHDSLGITMLYVTHDQSEALTMSDRIAIFHEGRIQHIGTPTEVYDAPANAFVATFMGESNSIHGLVTGHSGPNVLVKTDAGATLKAAAGGELLQVGARARILVRPERIAIADGAESADTRIEARISDVIYCGDHSRVGLDVAGVGRVVARLPHAEGQPVPHAGDSCIAHWSAGKALAFAEKLEG